MITMTEIARLSGVSQPTVSRVLNGNQQVHPDTRKRVLACAKKHGYQPNNLAKALQGSKTHLLAVLLTDLTNGFFADLASAIEEAARSRGYSIILLNSGYDLQRERECLDIMVRYRVDGLLAVPVEPNSETWYRNIERLNTPTVVITRRAKKFDCVHLDHIGAGREVAKLLTRLNYQEFIFVGPKRDGKHWGFQQELEAQNPKSASSCIMIHYQNFQQLTADLAKHCQNPNKRYAIFCSNDYQGLQTVSAATRLGLSIPNQVGIVGFDNTAISSMLYPQLTTVAQPLTEMANKAVDRLIYRINEGNKTPPQDIVLKAKIAQRETTV